MTKLFLNGSAKALRSSLRFCDNLQLYCMWFVSIRTQQKYKFVINFAFGKETRKKTDVFVHKNMDVMFNEPRIYEL